MPVSLETQEIMIAFAIDNKDNYASWGKYELDELQFAYDEMPEADRASTTGQRIKERIDELASGKDHLQDIKQEESPEHPLDDNEQEQATEQPALGITIASFSLVVTSITELNDCVKRLSSRV